MPTSARKKNSSATRWAPKALGSSLKRLTGFLFIESPTAYFYTLSLHAALPISGIRLDGRSQRPAPERAKANSPSHNPFARCQRHSIERVVRRRVRFRTLEIGRAHV